ARCRSSCGGGVLRRERRVRRSVRSVGERLRLASVSPAHAMGDCGRAHQHVSVQGPRGSVNGRQVGRRETFHRRALPPRPPQRPARPFVRPPPPFPPSRPPHPPPPRPLPPPFPPPP